MKTARLGVLVAVAIAAFTPLLARQNPSPPAAPAPATLPGQARGATQRPDEGPVRDANGAVIGFTKTAEIPGTPWRIHDASRPHPRIVTPGVTPADPPSDAIVLFDGKDLSKWVKESDPTKPAPWPVRDGYFETGVGGGSIMTREKFGDIQLHLEFATPSPGRGASQDRGNSGIKFMDRYELQILDSYENLTYADGQVGAIYGETPPLVNPVKKPGEWQVYDVVFEAPKFKDNVLVAPAYITAFLNGVAIQVRRAVMGPTSPTSTPHQYAAHEAELPIMLQDHAHPVRFRNVWVRRLAGYDQPEK
jgi:hypothetical protein